MHLPLRSKQFLALFVCAVFVNKSPRRPHVFIRHVSFECPLFHPIFALKEWKTVHFDWNVCELNMFLKLTPFFLWQNVFGVFCHSRRLQSTSGVFKVFQKQKVFKSRFQISNQGPTRLTRLWSFPWFPSVCYFSVLRLESSNALPCREFGICASSVHGILWLWQGNNKP